MDTFEDVNDKWHYWKTLFLEVVNKHIPLRKVRMKATSLPWITQEIRALMRTRNYFCSKAKSSGRNEDWVMYRRLRNHVTARLRMAKLLYFESLSEESRRNPRKLWNGLNKALGRKNKHKIDSLTTPQGILRDEQDIANEFSDFFSKWVSTSSDTDDDAELENLPEKLIKNVGEFSFHKVDEEVVLVLLCSL